MKDAHRRTATSARRAAAVATSRPPPQFDSIGVIQAYPDMLGIGRDENTAIVVTGDTYDLTTRERSCPGAGASVLSRVVKKAWPKR